jgi:hypothetical protein
MTILGLDNATRRLLPKEMDDQVIILASGIAPGMVFCPIYLTAWNYNFPTNVESILWKMLFMLRAGRWLFMRTVLCVFSL